ncbi:hypothetical protein CQW23_03926 [Capsicum baccatum]|uniref:SWIM-type domain-containing protein n=1 Tax=Capsicum baccatum TaxID=33114 RepID=A0A2G2XD88_CAPBA|nr:hypothetical protein CQW23_03926 [Capsicum baccatum]
MSIVEFVLVSGDFMGEWVETSKCYKWRSFTKVTIPIPVRHNSSYDKFFATVMQSMDLYCMPSDVVISYVMHSSKKVNPTIINSDVRVLTYIMDADTYGLRPILRINVVERSFEGPLNSLAPPSQFPAVDDDLIDDDLNDYKNDVDNTINMEDFSMHMEDFSSNSQDDEEDRKTESQAGHSFTDETNFCCGQTFADKKELEMQLDAAAARQSFDYYMEKSCTKLMKVQCLSRGCGWLLRAKNVRHLERILHIQNLKSIIEDEPDLYVISDRHISIANDFSHVYSRAHHGLCMRYLAENLCLNQHCGEHLYLFYTAAKAYSFDEFSDNFVELKSKCPEAAHVLENVLGFEKWSRAHFSGNRYDVMTSNIADSLNSILMDEWEYPMSYIFNSIAKNFSKKFRERDAFVGGKENIFVPSAERILRDNKSASNSFYVGNLNGVLNEYTVFKNGITVKVNLLEMSCSCRKFDLVKMWCEHAMASLRAKYDDGKDYGKSIYDYSSPIYKDESYLLAYSEAINMVPLEAEWTVPQELVDTKISPPPYDPKLRRKKVKSIKGVACASAAASSVFFSSTPSFFSSPAAAVSSSASAVVYSSASSFSSPVASCSTSSLSASSSTVFPFSASPC